jgi:hypothetical protein
MSGRPGVSAGAGGGVAECFASPALLMNASGQEVSKNHTDEENDMDNIRKTVLALVAVVGGLVATGTEAYSSATGCTPPPPFRKTCIFVNGKGLRVNYATVTNMGGPTGQAVISSNWDGRSHGGPVLRKGQA